VAYWPEHAKMLRKSYASLSSEAISHANEAAGLVEKIAEGDFTQAARRLQMDVRHDRRGGAAFSPHWRVSQQLFRRSGRLRLSGRRNDVSVHGWLADLAGSLANHILAANSTWMSSCKKPGREPGIWKLGRDMDCCFTQAARLPHMREVLGWDISPTSLGRTGACLARMGIADQVNLQTVDIAAPRGTEVTKFDNIVLSEVAEHLEDPASALCELRKMLAPEGRIFVNVPVNAADGGPHLPAAKSRRSDRAVAGCGPSCG